MADRKKSAVPLQQAFDEARFGARRTLNLRAQQPTAEQAKARCEQWLRQQQVEGATEALIITGRGLRSVGGFSPVRETIAALFPSLRRRNVITAFTEHSPGSFVVTLAPVRALFEAPRRRREKADVVVRPTIPQLAALETDMLALLSELAHLQLSSLGVRSPSPSTVEDEMLRQFSALSPAVGQSGDAEARLQQALVRALDEHDSM
jgi:hypothetical protein